MTVSPSISGFDVEEPKKLKSEIFFLDFCLF
jgi:hypothetical protein